MTDVLHLEYTLLPDCKFISGCLHYIYNSFFGRRVIIILYLLKTTTYIIDKAGGLVSPPAVCPISLARLLTRGLSLL